MKAERKEILFAETGVANHADKTVQAEKVQAEKTHVDKAVQVDKAGEAEKNKKEIEEALEEIEQTLNLAAMFKGEPYEKLPFQYFPMPVFDHRPPLFIYASNNKIDGLLGVVTIQTNYNLDVPRKRLKEIIDRFRGLFGRDYRIPLFKVKQYYGSIL
ncbi:hypothetical protein MPER_11830 [Moniliophthora perniciosa FA553]|nr:hypothetical protein MPER_11830 [Moniliophthora perniciosa FA553]